MNDSWDQGRASGQPGCTESGKTVGGWLSWGKQGEAGQRHKSGFFREISKTSGNVTFWIWKVLTDYILIATSSGLQAAAPLVLAKRSRSQEAWDLVVLSVPGSRLWLNFLFLYSVMPQRFASQLSYKLSALEWATPLCLPSKQKKQIFFFPKIWAKETNTEAMFASGWNDLVMGTMCAYPIRK